MNFHIPLTISSIDKLRKRSSPLTRFFSYRKKSALGDLLAQTNTGLTREQYLAISLQGAIVAAIIFFLLSSTIFVIAKVERAIIFAATIALLAGLLTFFSRTVYPRVYVTRKQRDIEQHLISALQDIHVQLQSGVPLFRIMVNISSSDYGALSDEFKKAVRRINAGYPQIQVLEELGEANPSPFFRRTLWQISNGMRAGSDISIVIHESIHALSQEQLIQIQNYGNKLNPMIMFYMLISVILPALSITFLTIISSLVQLPQSISTLLFIGLLVGVIIIQTLFLGVIKSIRPSLL